MPGRYFLRRPLAEIAQHLGADPGALVAEPRNNVAPGQEVLVCPPDRALTQMRWGIIPVGRVNARGRPVMETVVNARSETVFEKSAFDGVRRCLLPTDGWYEWTGETRRKTPWRISRRDGAPVVFAGIYDVWTAPGGGTQVWQVAALTCEPNADVQDIHHRMGVILEPAQFATWLGADQTEAAALMRPLPDGLLQVEEAVGVDWDGP
ncbi:Gifsy-2 prophage protein [Candidatus Rhodobacter oscarellae]|uniref:Abasic site processing protein n=1 Tax=Candidatus Rhodobacter oscarellae TaxID=1675527 RepID=A0A0J9E9K1_9RHOB|nr:SOS response-associated peptidase [Candidatus Rhodobacter lobularis]KMW59306.1 Gifsy-2 prophage protein [Candidatus Rhodobacter lobularis]